MKPLSEAQLWGAMSGIPERVFVCVAGHRTRVRTENNVAYCKALIGAGTTCSRPAEPRGAPISE